MSRRRIGQEQFGFAVDRGQHSSLDALAKLIDWVPIDQAFGVILLCEGRACLATNGLVQGDAAVDLVRLVRRQACRGAGRQKIIPTVLRVLGFRADT